MVLFCCHNADIPTATTIRVESAFSCTFFLSEGKSSMQRGVIALAQSTSRGEMFLEIHIFANKG